MIFLRACVYRLYELNDEKFSSEEVSYIPSAPPIPLAVEESGKIKPASIQVSEASYTISARGTSHAVVSYDACVRLCLHAWAKGCMEARMFLENECALLREAFGVKEHLSLLEEEMLVSQSSQAPHEGVAPKPKKNIGKMMVQVWRVKTDLDAAPTGNGILYVEPSLKKIEKLRVHFSNISTRISSKWRALKKINLRAKGHVLAERNEQFHLCKQMLTRFIISMSMWHVPHPLRACVRPCIQYV
ncbi:hypothetical protein YC2023_087409 [Brassica napus]